MYESHMRLQEGHSSTDQLLHVLWLNTYSIYFAIYVIEVAWVIKSNIILNKGTVLIVSSTMTCLVLKVFTYWWQVAIDIYSHDSTEWQDILSEVADFSNIFVYICTYFFIFTLWKSYKCLSDEETFNRYNKHYMAWFWGSVGFYFAANVFFLIYDIADIKSSSNTEKGTALYIVNIILNAYKLLVELSFTYLFIRAYIYLRKALNNHLIQAYTSYDYLILALIILWTVKIFMSNGLYFFQVSGSYNKPLYDQIFQYYRLWIIVSNFCFSTFLLWFLYLSTKGQKQRMNTKSVVRVPLYQFDPFPDQITYFLKRRTTVNTILDFTDGSESQ